MEQIEKIEKYAVELESQIRQITDFKGKMEEMLVYARQISNTQTQKLATEVKSLREEVDILTKHLLLKGMPGINRYETDLQRLRELVGSDQWPQAVPDDMIPKTEEDKQVRAENILDLFITEFIADKRVLDVGCGEGHLVQALVNKGAQIAVGFDVKKQWAFSSYDKGVWTNNLEEIKKYAPYDIIILYDVLDHIQVVNPYELLYRIKNALASSGRVYIRCHPWCSRHGGHLYNKLNKAFIHLLFDETEFLRLHGIVPEFTLKLTNPLATYREWFQQAGFIVKTENVLRRKLEESFEQSPPVLRKKLEETGIEVDNFEIEYIDYVLEINESNQQIF